MSKSKSFHIARDVADRMREVLCSSKYERIIYDIIYQHTLPWNNKPFIIRDSEFLKEKSSLCCLILIPCKQRLSTALRSVVKKGIVIIVSGKSSRRSEKEYVLNLPKIMRLARKLYLMLDSYQGESEAKKIKEALCSVEEYFSQREIPDIKLEMRMPTVDDVLKKKVGVKTKKKKKVLVKDETKTVLKLVPKPKVFKNPYTFEDDFVARANARNLKVATFIEANTIDTKLNEGRMLKDFKVLSIIKTFLKDHGENAVRISQILIDQYEKLQMSWCDQHEEHYGDHCYDWFDWYWYHENKKWIMNEINFRPIYTWEEEENEGKEEYQVDCIPLDCNQESVEERKDLLQESRSLAGT